jgi:ABC-type phosphate/phosphonate transport system substrate-binding protein
MKKVLMMILVAIMCSLAIACGDDNSDDNADASDIGDAGDASE